MSFHRLFTTQYVQCPSVYACMCMHLHVHVFKYVGIFVYIYFVFIFVCMYLCLCLFVSVYGHIHMYFYICIYLCVYACKCMCFMYVYMYVFLHISLSYVKCIVRMNVIVKWKLSYWAKLQQRPPFDAHHLSKAWRNHILINLGSPKTKFNFMSILLMWVFFSARSSNIIISWTNTDIKVDMEF